MSTISRPQPLRFADSYTYSRQAITALRQSMSAERMEPYLQIAQGSETRALRFDVRNAALGSAFLGPLQALEVTLRNSVHALASAMHGEDWYDTVCLEDAQRRGIDMARRLLRREGKTESPGRVVAAASFGFWVGLFARAYEESLWRPLLHRAFEPVPSRAVVHEQLDRLRTLRNRIAHHESILGRRLNDDHRRILDTLEMLSPEVALWVGHHSRVPETLATPLSRLNRF